MYAYVCPSLNIQLIQTMLVAKQHRRNAMLSTLSDYNIKEVDVDTTKDINSTTLCTAN